MTTSKTPKCEFCRVRPAVTTYRSTNGIADTMHVCGARECKSGINRKAWAFDRAWAAGRETAPRLEQA